jgi:cytochrome P450
MRTARQFSKTGCVAPYFEQQVMSNAEHFLGVFTMTDVKQHATRRRLLSRPFSRTHMVEHWESTVRGYMALAVQQMKHNAVEGKVDIFKWWLLLGSDVSVHLAFGESFSMLKNGKVFEAFAGRREEKLT